MEAYAPFRPAAPLFAVAATPSAPVNAALLGSGLAGDVTIAIYNEGVAAADVVLGFGPTSDAAVAAAAIPLLSGSVPNAVIIKGNTEHSITVNGQFIFCAARCLLGSATVYLQAGWGFSG